MANQEHVDLLLQGQDIWNQWRVENPSITPDLSFADLDGIELHSRTLVDRLNLKHVNLTRSSLRQATLDAVDLSFASLSEGFLADAYIGQTILFSADLRSATLDGANLQSADLRLANLQNAELIQTRLPYADLSGANLQNANLEHAIINDTKLCNTNLEGSRIYGISAWNVGLGGTNQSNLIVTKDYQPLITVDNLEVAQLIYLLLNNSKIRDVIDSISSKTVLILGRFTPKRKLVLESIRGSLRKHNLIPVLFDFSHPTSRNLTETISTLAHISRFVVADLTDAKSVPHELQRIIPHLPSVPVQTLIQFTKPEYGMFKDFLDYPWVGSPFRYRSVDELVSFFESKVIPTMGLAR